VILTDTVGFIRELPKDLFAAFRSTFEEAADADLLLHVVDASDPAMDDHIRTVLDVLDELDLCDLERLLVLNKVDMLEPAQCRILARSNPDAVLVSAQSRETTRPLIERIARELAAKWEASAKGPSLEPAVEADPDEGGQASAPEEMTTLDQMLRAAGRGRKARVA
jgi:GTP-binding protein HflX